MFHMNLSPEEEVLLCCARTQMTSETHSKLAALLNEDMDWKHIVDSSDLHEISPLLYWNLKGFEKTPDDVIAHFKRRYLETVGRNMIFYHELAKILGVFSDAAIPVICLKGIFLAKAVYGNMGLRPLADIDLLIQDKDLPACRDQLSSLGYQCLDTEADLENHNPPHEGRSQARFGNVVTKTLLEIHWCICPPSSPYTVDSSALWKRSQSVEIDDMKVLVLSPEDLLQHLSLHMFCHSKQGRVHLKWCCDIAEVLAHYGDAIDWTYLVRKSLQDRTDEAIACGLYIARTYLGSHIPESLFKRECSITAQDILRVQ